MAGLSPTPLTLPNLFSREEFFSGGPNGAEGITKIRSFDNQGNLRHVFDSMLAVNVSSVDAERVSYFLKANGNISLYAFGRAVQAFRVQAILIDAATIDAANAAQLAGADLDTEIVGAKSRQAYEQFMALYEREFRISRAIRKKRKIKLEVRGYDYTGFICSEKSGYASNAEWMCIVNFEFLALRAEIIPVPQSRLSAESV